MRIADLEFELAEARRATEEAEREAQGARSDADVRTADAAARPAADQAAARLTTEACAADAVRTLRAGRSATGPLRRPATARLSDLQVPRDVLGSCTRRCIFPLRLTPLGPRGWALGPAQRRDAVARAPLVPPPWPAGDDRDPQLPRRRAGGASWWRRSARRRRADGPDHRHRRRERSRAPRGPAARSTGSRCVAGERNGGFSANVNRGLRAADPASRRRAAQLRRDPAARLAGLPPIRHAARGANVGIAGAKLLYPDNRIQYAGTIRNARAPEWFDHRYRGKPADWGPADVAGPTLAATGACMYITPRRRSTARPVRRGVRDGLRGRRLLPACLAGRIRGGLRAGRAAAPPRVGDPGHRRRASASGARSACSGSAGRVLRRAAGPRPTTAACASST